MAWVNRWPPSIEIFQTASSIKSELWIVLANPARAYEASVSARCIFNNGSISHASTEAVELWKRSRKALVSEPTPAPASSRWIGLAGAEKRDVMKVAIAAGVMNWPSSDFRFATSELPTSSLTTSTEFWMAILPIRVIMANPSEGCYQTACGGRWWFLYKLYRDS